MKQTVSVVFLFVFTSLSFGQVRIGTLVIKPKETYELKESDILVVDTLIMMDSSVLLLNKLKRENFIHAKKIVLHRGSLIDGKGVQGLAGRNGRTGISSSGPCSDGGIGKLGTDGTSGGGGVNLFISFSDIVSLGIARIDVSGGDAGDGGNGGNGGGGGSGTRLCEGGSGGKGGPGANGGKGGDSGTITFHAASVPELRSMLGERIITLNYGGNPGSAGEGGGGGYPGFSPTGKSTLDGKSGKKGVRGKDGTSGKAGGITFQDK